MGRQYCKKDLITGLNISYNGFTIGSSFLAKGKNKTTDVKIKPGENISLVFTEIGGFKDVEGKAYPGASIIVTDSKGKTVLDNPDLFSHYDSTGVDIALVKEALSIEFSVPTTGYEKGEVFFWKSKIWDKKSKSELNCDLKLEVE